LSFAFFKESILYADIVDINNKEEFISSISRCLNVLANKQYYDDPKHISKGEEILQTLKVNEKAKQIAITTNIKYPSLLSVSCINNKTILPKKISAMMNLKMFKNFTGNNLIDIYNFAIKKLK
jgi:hypothetical protein